jgi:hypothetical protein
MVGCCSRITVTPIEDGPFLQVDSGGSKTVLMPSDECVGYGWRMSVNIYPGCLFLRRRPMRPTFPKQGETSESPADLGFAPPSYFYLSFLV